MEKANFTTEIGEELEGTPGRRRTRD